MTKTVLIVEDDKSCSDLYRLRFEMAKWQVETVPSAELALEFLKKGKNPDAIVLDLMLPKMQGGELLLLLKNNPNTKEIPVIVMTAISFNPKDDEITKGPADAYLLKIDVTPKELVEKVEQLAASS